jgi:NADPH-dependent F420 reductase
MHHMAERVETPAVGPGESVGVTVGILGGTGDLGQGLASRLAPAVGAVLIGSRDVDRARAAAATIGDGVEGVSNSEACVADFVVVAVPWPAHDVLLTEVASLLEDRVVIDAVNPLGFDERGPFALPVAAGSATQRAQQLLASSRVVGAFHHVAASRLSSTEPLDMDVLVVGDDRHAVDQVCALVDAVTGLRGIYAGRLRNAGQVEAMTANLIAINRRYRTQAGLRVTGL